MTQAKLVGRIDRYMNASREAITGDIAALVAARSVEGKAGPGAPFGPGPRAALNAALAVAERLGLAACDGDGYVGWAEVPGGEEGHLATITHVDTVPDGDGWDGDPCVLRQREGWLLGRGVADNKGPSVLCLYAARFFQESGLPLRYGLRVLLGTNEETGMADVAYYLARQPQPLFCFSPDAGFPVCNGEKGLFTGRFVSGPLQGALVRVQGGIAGNVVPGKACCVVKSAAPPPAAENVEAEPAGEGLWRLTARGVGGHAASPEGTVNAIGVLVNALLESRLCGEGEAEFLRLLRLLHSAADGSGVGIACADDKFTPLTCVGGQIELSDGRLTQSVNIRFPAATDAAALAEKLEAAAARHGGSFVTGSTMPPFYIPPASPAITALTGAFAAVSGQAAKPFTMGGGTYARHFNNAVSIGATLEQAPRPAFAGPEHGANEGASLEGLLRALKIYILALWKLQEVDFAGAARK